VKEMVPAGQIVQVDEEATGDHLPSSHTRQSVEPGTGVYHPLGQLMQEDWCFSEYFPCRNMK